MRKHWSWVALLALACSDASGPSEVIDGPPDNLTMDIVGGNSQQDTVLRRLPEPLVVRVVEDSAGQLGIAVQGSLLFAQADPIPGEVISWRVTNPAFGEMFVDVTVTDSVGLAQNFWTLGTAAGEGCYVEARVIRDGQPVVVENFCGTALPGDPDTVSLSIMDTTILTGDSLDFSSMVLLAKDMHGNAISDLSGLQIIGAPARFEVSGSVLRATHEGEGEVLLSLRGSRPSRVTVQSLFDFEDSEWSIAFACIGGSGYIDEFGPNVHPDSMVWTSVSVDSVQRDPFDFSRVLLHIQATRVEWWDNGQVREDSIPGPMVLEFHQTLNQLMWGTGKGVAIAVQDSPRIYSLENGLGPCSRTSWESGRFHMEEL